MAEPADSWYDDARITDEQIEAVRHDLDTPVAQRGAAFAPFVVRKLLAEIDRLNVVLDANRVVRNAAESSCRTLKGVVHLLKTERTQLKERLEAAWTIGDKLGTDLFAAHVRADAAERELAELRAEAEDPFNPQRIAEAVKRARRQRDEAVEAIAAERDEYVQELAQLRQQLQSATVLPERWRELLAERDAARRELAELRERIAGAIVNMPEPEAPDSYAVPAWYDGYERAVEDAARIARERKAADGA